MFFVHTIPYILQKLCTLAQTKLDENDITSIYYSSALTDALKCKLNAPKAGDTIKVSVVGVQTHTHTLYQIAESTFIGNTNKSRCVLCCSCIKEPWHCKLVYTRKHFIFYNNWFVYSWHKRIEHRHYGRSEERRHPIRVCFINKIK
jgi:hypothetical protein